MDVVCLLQKGGAVDFAALLNCVQVQPFSVLGTTSTGPSNAVLVGKAPQDVNAVVVDPAGTCNYSGLGASGAIYDALHLQRFKQDKDNTPVQFPFARDSGDCDELKDGKAKFYDYRKAPIDAFQSGFTGKDAFPVIHVRGPQANDHELETKLKTLYKNIFVTAAMHTKAFKVLRLLPVSMGIFNDGVIDTDTQVNITCEAIYNALAHLDTESTTALCSKSIELCIFEREQSASYKTTWAKKVKERQAK